MVLPGLYGHLFLLQVHLVLAQELLESFHTHLDTTGSFTLGLR